MTMNKSMSMVSSRVLLRLVQTCPSSIRLSGGSRYGSPARAEVNHIG
jgi:hypothetical protein